MKLTITEAVHRIAPSLSMPRFERQILVALWHAGSAGLEVQELLDQIGARSGASLGVHMSKLRTRLKPTGAKLITRVAKATAQRRRMISGFALDDPGDLVARASSSPWRPPADWELGRQCELIFKAMLRANDWIGEPALRAVLVAAGSKAASKPMTRTVVGHLRRQLPQFVIEQRRLAEGASAPGAWRFDADSRKRLATLRTQWLAVENSQAEPSSQGLGVGPR